MQFISVKEAAQKWGISERRVRALCESGRIEGVSRCGDWVWSIPADTQRPADGRTLRYIKNMSLKTGTQDYKAVDKLKKSSSSYELTEKQKVRIIQEAFFFDGKELTDQQITGILKLQNQGIALSDQIEVLNMHSALSNLGYDLTEKVMKDVNSRLCTSINEKAKGKYKLNADQAEETEAMFVQYAGSWSVLHPVARASFLFSEIIRINMFQSFNVQTAFVLLANEMVKAKLPPALFGTENISQLKAALASSQIRGNAQGLVSMLLEAIKNK